MPDLLLELLSEEIPARMQARAADDLRRLVTDGLVERGFLYEGARTFVTPRRLTLAVQGLPARGRDVREERKGPRVGAPQAAIDGFLRSAGLASIDQATIQSDPKKGDSYVAVVEKPGRPTAEVLAEMLPGIIRAFPWPKSMRWGPSSGPEGRRYVLGEGRGAEALRWVRPLRSILCLFGTEHEEPEVIRFAVDGIASGNTTMGHRFMSDGQPITVKRLDDYLARLEAAKVIADPARRKEIVVEKAKELCFVHGLELVEDDGLAEEVAGLVEWPVPLMGRFEEAFLDVPPEVIRATIRANQKCFVARAKDGRLAPRFIATANVEAADGGELITAGNARVIRARLADARFFWETDKRVPLEERLEKLKSVRFHEKLGTQYERVERIAALAEEIAPLVKADPQLAKRAAMLAKADLATEMVGEFPELQGLMGRYYATLEGEHPDVCAAIEEHYKPQGPSDRVPTNPVSIAVALADKLDTLVGFWAIDEKPTGSKDPYALRRAALGCIVIELKNQISIPSENIRKAAERAIDSKLKAELLHLNDELSSATLSLSKIKSLPLNAQTKRDADFAEFNIRRIDSRISGVRASRFYLTTAAQPLVADLLSFFHERLKVMLREQGARHDLVDAVLGAGGGATNDDLLSIVNRVKALTALLATEDGANLLAGYRRAANILRAEEKKDGAGAFDGKADVRLLAEPEEKALAHVLDAVEHHVADHLLRDDYAGAMRQMAELRPAVDAFFDKILVNADDPALRANRLKLLAHLRRVTAQVADFGRIGG